MRPGGCLKEKSRERKTRQAAASKDISTGAAGSDTKWETVNATDAKGLIDDNSDGKVYTSDSSDDSEKKRYL